jgi:hypothetical protein
MQDGAVDSQRTDDLSQGDRDNQSTIKQWVAAMWASIITGDTHIHS